MTESAAAVEVHLSCRVGTTGLATVRCHPQHPQLIRVAVGASVRFTIAEADVAAVRDAIECARYSGHGSTLLTSNQGLYLTGHPRRWYETEERFRLSIGSPLRRCAAGCGAPNWPPCRRCSPTSRNPRAHPDQDLAPNHPPRAAAAAGGGASARPIHR